MADEATEVKFAAIVIVKATAIARSIGFDEYEAWLRKRYDAQLEADGFMRTSPWTIRKGYHYVYGTADKVPGEEEWRISCLRIQIG